MGNRILDVLMGKEDNYLLPFYWQHGESEMLLRQGVEKIAESGIKAFCVESRPHPDFLGPDWWRDMDILMEEARNRGMQVWVLDDSHFPSGYVNGTITPDSPYSRRAVETKIVDCAGPFPGACFWPPIGLEERLLAVVAGRRDSDSADLADLKDLTHLVQDGRLYWDVPEGDWSVITVREGPAWQGQRDYLNLLDRDGVKYYIDTVYQPHFDRYGADFGNTFAGFFSDEPCLGNVTGQGYSHYAKITIPHMPIPWCQELEEALHQLWGALFGLKLSAVNRQSALSPQARLEYMLTVTKMYGRNFTTQVGDWCREHNCLYIGHVIEDNGCHARLGMGTGHYFNALEGQDMAGIDVVLQQFRPGLDHPFSGVNGARQDGRFYHYGLAKLGVSLGQMNPLMKGRTMCEVFGAYGWSEGLPLMKRIADHMLSRGVNRFVPHAFSQKDFPDPDAPPHFFARGNDPQFPVFGQLMRYMNRVSHLLDGGSERPTAAILYTAEAEWTGEYAPFETVGELLAKQQIDYEIVPTDYLVSGTVQNGCLHVGNQVFRCLIVPYIQRMMEPLVRWLDAAAGVGFPVFVMDALPVGLDDRPVSGLEGNLTVLPLSQLVQAMKQQGLFEVEVQGEHPWLRYFPYDGEGYQAYLFLNEAVAAPCDTQIRLPVCHGKRYRYAPMENQLYAVQAADPWVSLSLAPGEMTLFLDTSSALPFAPASRPGDPLQISDFSCTVTCYETGKDTVFSAVPALGDVSRQFPDFSGKMVYDCTFTVSEVLPDQPCLLSLGRVFETAEVVINGVPCGVRIAAPYDFTVSCLKPGLNRMEVTVTNTLGHRVKDFFSQSLPFSPSGLLDLPVICPLIFE